MHTNSRNAPDDNVVFMRNKETGIVTEERRARPHWARRPVFVMLVVASAFLVVSAIRLALTV